jgi:hypothetical protein
MKTEDGVDLYGPYIGLEVPKDVKKTQTGAVVDHGNVAPH